MKQRSRWISSVSHLGKTFCRITGKLFAGAVLSVFAVTISFHIDANLIYVGNGSSYHNAQWHAMAETEAESKGSISSTPKENRTVSGGATEDTNNLTDKIKEIGKKNWRLILVNREYPLDESYSFKKKNLSNSLQVDSRIYDSLSSMMEAGRKEGCVFIICSAYRSYDRQVERFDENVTKYMSDGYTYEEACEETLKTLSMPGCSEHQTGLAVDIVAKKYQMLNSGYANTKEAKWLEEHAHEYGFIVRYPEDKVEITGIDYEPWHFRYVGVEAATEIYERGLCLEEYLEQMAKEELKSSESKKR